MKNYRPLSTTTPVVVSATHFDPWPFASSEMIVTNSTSINGEGVMWNKTGDTKMTKGVWDVLLLLRYPNGEEKYGVTNMSGLVRYQELNGGSALEKV